MPERRSVRDSIFSAVQNNTVAIAVVVIILFLVIPMPKVMLDVAMVLNLSIAFIILLTVVYMKRSADFTSFPRVILLFTLYGIGINVASTRNILVHPVTGSGNNIRMAGQSEMVQTFANIVAGNNVVIGFVIFIILIVVQVLVITKGTDRITEVKARFTLDSMNNKMFDIQNDLNSGIITEEESKRRKENVRREVDFYSAMDGASKFVSGTVKASIFITVVNLIGGLITGMVMGGLSITDALNSYAKLTIGDGLMSQVPAIILSFSTGMLVSGTDSDTELADQLKTQFTYNGTIYMIVGGTLAVMGAAFHNSASIVLIPVGGLMIYAGISIRNSQKLKKEKEKLAEEEAKSQKQTGSNPDEISPLVELQTLSLDLGFALVPLVDKKNGAELIQRVTRIRKETALDLGLVVPPIRIRDNMNLQPEEYSFKIRGIEAGHSRLKLGSYMCLNTGGVAKEHELQGERTIDPAFGIEAIWLPESKKAEAERAGYAVIDPPTIIATHLTELIRHNAADILSRQEVSKIIETVKEKNPVVVDEVLSGEHRYTYGEIERVLKNLLEEQVSIRNMVVILETLANFAAFPRDITFLTEKVRQSLGAQICLQYVDEGKVLHVMRLSQNLAEQVLSHRADNPGGKPFVAFDPVDGRKYIQAMSSSYAAVRDRNYLPIVLCPDEVRQLVKSSTEREIPGLIVLSISEIMSAGPGIKIETIGEINVQ